MTKPTPILIAGPTASGKSALALSIAEEIGGTVINADAMQVYRELRILTARPNEEDERKAPHALYGHVPAAEAYSAARYAADARAAIEAAQADNRTPIIVGGTGLYFKALTEGLSPIPAIPDDIRSYWRARAAEEGAAALHAVLKQRDAEMAARLRETDPQRIVRALEVLEATGVSLARWQERPGEPVLFIDPERAFLVTRDRVDLRNRCDARFDAMMREGALEEVHRLRGLGLSADLPAMRAIGVAPLIALIDGQLTREEAAEAARAETRQYVKRQETWMKRNMIAWKHASEQEMETLVADIRAIVKVSP
jgi:tRNA dimethylallyltransferase